MQALRALLRSTAIGNGSLTALIEDRFYPDELALVSNPVFPCINFRIDGGDTEAVIPKVQYPNVRIWAWSTISKDQAYQIYEVVFNIFVRQNYTSSDVYILCHKASAPAEIFDPFSKAYGVSAQWSMTAIDRT